MWSNVFFASSKICCVFTLFIFLNLILNFFRSFIHVEDVIKHLKAEHNLSVIHEEEEPREMADLVRERKLILPPDLRKVTCPEQSCGAVMLAQERRKALEKHAAKEHAGADLGDPRLVRNPD